MRIRISDPSRLHDLLDFLRRADCVAEQASRDTMEVFVPRAPTDRQARREVSLYLATWKAENPGAEVELID